MTNPIRVSCSVRITQALTAVRITQALTAVRYIKCVNQRD
jgi:hypothetical protein